MSAPHNDARVVRRVVANLPDESQGLTRHLLHCGHVVVCNGRFGVRVEIHCPQCQYNEVALRSVIHEGTFS